MMNFTKEIERLENYYESEISPELDGLRKIMNITKYIAIVSLIAFANFFLGIGGDTGMIISGVVVGIGFFFIFFNSKKINAFFKEKVTLPIMKQLENENFSFNYDGEILESNIRKSRLLDFREGYSLSQNKLLKYRDKERTIKMLNIQLTNKSYDEEDGDTETTTTEGLFVVIPTQIKIEGSTIVLVDMAEKIVGTYIGGLLQSKKYGALKKISLDSPEFEKKFIVYGEDEVMAHYLLKHTVMELLSELREKHMFEISFVDGEIYIFFPFDGGWLEAEVNLNKKKDDLASFDIIREDIEVIYAAIDAVHRMEKHHLLS